MQISNGRKEERPTQRSTGRQPRCACLPHGELRGVGGRKP
jgi:hypothetical protein